MTFVKNFSKLIQLLIKISYIIVTNIVEGVNALVSQITTKESPASLPPQWGFLFYQHG